MLGTKLVLQLVEIFWRRSLGEKAGKHRLMNAPPDLDVCFNLWRFSAITIRVGF